MPEIPQITAPFGRGVSYNNSSKHTDSSAAPFDISQLTGSQTVTPISERNPKKKQMDMSSERDLTPPSVLVKKDPGLAAETLKSMLNINFLTEVSSINTALFEKLNQLMKTIFLTPANIQTEILHQEEQNTIFKNDKFYDELRELNRNTKDPEVKIAVSNVLKAINFSDNKNEILKALSSNMKFLSEYFSSSQKLSARLMQLSQEWNSEDAPMYFEFLKSQTINLMTDVGTSLLSDAKTQMLIPLIIHNLSRYNTNKQMLSDSFETLLLTLDSEEIKEALISSFKSFVQKMFGQKNNIYNYNNNYNSYNTKNQDQSSVSNNLFTNEKNIQEQTTGEQVRNTESQAQNTSDGIKDTANQEQALNKLNQNVQKEYNRSTQQKTQEEIKLENDFEHIETKTNRVAQFLSKKLNETDYVSMLHDKSYDIIGQFQQVMQGFKKGKQSGLDSLKQLIQTLLIGSEGRKEVPNLTNDFSKLNSIRFTVDYLNNLLRNMPDIPLRQNIYTKFMQIIEGMAVNGELPDEPEQEVKSKLGGLTQFISQNIDNPTLKAIDSFQPNTLLQSMINAPGIFTPLMHYILPLQIQNTRAFGELWVDNEHETKDKNGASIRGQHLFLVFDIENIGKFELDIYAAEKELNISLLCPKDYANAFNSIPDKIESIATAVGYHAQKCIVGPLERNRTLAQVFPKILEKRVKLNAKA